MYLAMSNKSPVSSSASPPLLDGRPVKKEAPDDEIKDFAETAMNELLGWYGYDSRGGRTLQGRSPPPQGMKPLSKSPNAEENDDCAWCNNPITPDSNPLNQSIGDKFCSELCFSQSRRATFKRAKTCDWCRHIRHTVSYVDFQDGATQLQFCSDKCLNQYKMHIFCRETQAHLDLNPHLVNAVSSNTNLITPDLWLKNCRSRSVSPFSDHSESHNGNKLSPDNESTSPNISLNISPEISITNTAQNTAKSPHPLITVAPSSKLMRPRPSSEEKGKTQTTAEMRREHRIMKTNSKKRRNSRCSSTVTSQNFQKHSSTASSLSKPQDLTVRSPSLSQEGSPNASILRTPQNIIPSPPITINPRIPNLHPINFPNSFLNLQQPSHVNVGPNNFQNSRNLRPPFIPQHNSYIPRPPPLFPNDQPRNPIPPSLQQLGIGIPPPMTVLVPYPVILPIPLPIPIPIPIMDFVKAYETKKWTPHEKTQTKVDTDDNNITDEPLDFTINVKRKCSDETSERKHDEDFNKNKVDTPVNVDDVTNDKESPLETIDGEFTGHLEPVDSANPEQTLPRFKITRLGAKMSKIVVPKPKEISESTRPLRKRRRLVEVPAEEDCGTVVNKSRKPVHA